MKTTNVYTLQDLFRPAESNVWEKTNAKENVHYFNEDLLTLAVALHRLDKGHPHRYGITNPELATLITDLDRIRAKNISDYYSKRLMFLQLQGKELTNYRSDLLKFLHTKPEQDNRYKYHERYLGMAYRLPYFYDYDRDIDTLFVLDNVKVKSKERRFKGVKKLKFVKSTCILKKHVNDNQYWFVDEQGDNYAVSINAKNPLIHLMDRVLSNNEVTLDAQYYMRLKDNREYFKIENYTFL